MSNPEAKLVCPQCRSASRVKAAGSFWTCRKCGGWFDGTDPDEGGSHFDDPTKRIENFESRQRARRRRWML